MEKAERQRRLPVGAEVLAGKAGVHFRVWAPKRRRVAVALEGQPGAEIELAPERAAPGYFSGVVPAAGAGALYRYRLDNDATLYPDPASRFQPEGPHGPSRVEDPARFRWTDAGWRGVNAWGQVVYELHVGTFTREGTWEAAARELEALAELGVTVLELMPVAEFPGRFGWGYDGVNLFAPTRLYGEPDAFRRFVDRAHAAGLGVILDVVYNHLGPDGNYLKSFADAYFTDRYKNEWGEPINFDGPDARPVRELFVANAGYWIDEYHLDGLRLDATQSIFDDGSLTGEHVLAEMTRRARSAAGARSVYIVAENEPQHTRLVRPLTHEGYGMDALWNDDFHHTARVAATGRREAYYVDYTGSPQEFVSAARHGYLYQGQRYAWQKKRRGTSARGLAPSNFVAYLQNHDQVANSCDGCRLHQVTSPGRYRALTALLLLGPATPMLFQGQEFAASAPFLYFADHKPELAKLVAAGRREFLAQFPAIATPEMLARLADPADPATFERCKLDLAERATRREAYALHRDLLRLRRDDVVLRAPRAGGCEGAVLAPAAFALRFVSSSDTGRDDRVLVVNLGADLALVPCPEPLLAPPEGARWSVLWSSEDPRYGGRGTPPVEANDEGELRVPAECAVLLGAP